MRCGADGSFPKSTLTSHINAARKAIGDNGQEQRLVRTIARKGFRFVGDVREADAPDGFSSPKTEPATPDETAAPARTLPDKPSIAVLAVPEPERRRRAGVLRRRRGGGHHHRAVAHSLAVRHRAQFELHLQGPRGRREAGRPRARRALRAGRQRAQGREPGAHHRTADRCRRRGASVGGTLRRQPRRYLRAAGPGGRRASSARSRRNSSAPRSSARSASRPKISTPTTTICAAWRDLHRGTREAIDEALPLFKQAIELDPDFASAYAMAAWCHFWRKVNGWMTDRAARDSPRARAWPAGLSNSGADDAVALARGGHALAHLAGDLDGGIALLDRAVMLNPNLAAAWFLGGFLRVWHGEPDGAIEHFARAMRLSPLDPEIYRMQAGMAAAHLFAGRFDAASSWADKAFRDLPSFLMVAGVIAASHALAGRPEEGAASDGSSAQARSLAAHLQSQRIGFRSAGRRSCDVRGRLAQGRAAGIGLSRWRVGATAIQYRRWCVSWRDPSRSPRPGSRRGF